MRSLFPTTLLAALLANGCTQPADQLDPGETDDVAADGKQDSSSLQLGRYDVSPEFDMFYSLTLSRPNTYAMQGGCKTKCNQISVDNGTFKLTKSGSKHYIRLYSAFNQGALLARFSYVVTSGGVKLTDTSDEKVYDATLQADPTSPVAVLGADLGGKTLACVPSIGDPNEFDIAITNGMVSIQADNTRMAKYSLDTAKIASGQLRLALSNDVDGPLAEDTLVWQLADLAKLSSGATVSGTDTYSEQFDGTTSRYKLTCHLK